MIIAIDWAGPEIDLAGFEVFGPGGPKGRRAHFRRLCQQAL